MKKRLKTQVCGLSPNCLSNRINVLQNTEILDRMVPFLQIFSATSFGS